MIFLSQNPITTARTIQPTALEFDNYQHSISAAIGFDKLSFFVQSSQQELQRLFDTALNQHVVRYSLDGQRVVWEGYVHALALSLPGLHVRISMDGIYNNVTVRYKNVSAGGVTDTADTISAPVADAESIAQFGTRQYEYTARTPLTASSAAQLAQMILREYKQPRASATVSDGADNKLQFECRGYGHKLAERVYTATGTGTVNASFLVQSIISAVGEYVANSIITTNSLAVSPAASNTTLSFSALALLQQIAALGDASFNRWLCQINENRVFSYSPVASTARYFRSVSDPQGILRDANGNAIDPLEIRAGYWLMTTDTDPFLADTFSPVDDPRLTFIETVSFTAPGNLSIVGGANSQLSTMFARLSQNNLAL